MTDREKTRGQLVSENEELRQRVAALEALRESEERCRLLVESIPHPVGHYDADGKLIECNCRWYEYTGQTFEEAQGDGWMKAVHPDDLARIVQAVRKAVAGGESYQSEHRLRRCSDGSYRWHLAQAKPRRDASGAIVGWFSSCIDVNDAKRAELALAEREARLLEAQEVACLGFYVLDVATGSWTSSVVLDRIFGIPADYAKTVEGWGDLIHPDDRQEMLDYFSREVIGARKPFDCEYRIVRQRGQGKCGGFMGWVDWSSTKRGGPSSMVGASRTSPSKSGPKRSCCKGLQRRIRGTAGRGAHPPNWREANEQLQSRGR